MEPPTLPISASAQKKRRRPALACEACRRRKVRCDRNLPCGTCVRSKNALCTYTTQATTSNTSNSSLGRKESPKHGFPQSGAAALALPEPILYQPQPLPTPRHSAPSSTRAADSDDPSPIHIPELTASAGEHSGPADFGLWQPVIQPRPAPVAAVPGGSVRDTASTPGSNSNHGSSSTVNSLVDRVKQLEQQLSDLMVRGDERDETAAVESTVMREGLRYSRGCVSKTRFFGQSHWMNAADMVRLSSFRLLASSLALFRCLDFSSLFLPFGSVDTSTFILTSSALLLSFFCLLMILFIQPIVFCCYDSYELS